MLVFCTKPFPLAVSRVKIYKMNNFENFEKEKMTINLVNTNIYSLLGIIPITLIYFVPFYILWKDKFSISYLKQNLKDLNFTSYSLDLTFLVIFTMLIGIILHELIHGLTWSIFAKNGFKSMKFGILLKMLTPYCHCKEPLKVKEYIIGALMPSIILGIIPGLLAIILGNVTLLAFGTFFTIVALGDFMIVNLLKKEDKNSYVLDHPSEAGCFIYREKKQTEQPTRYWQ